MEGNALNVSSFGSGDWQDANKDKTATEIVANEDEMFFM
jgi:hypothetical protein